MNEVNPNVVELARKEVGVRKLTPTYSLKPIARARVTIHARESKKTPSAVRCACSRSRNR